MSYSAHSFNHSIKVLSDYHPELVKMMEQIDRQNPYKSGKKYTMWKEQCYINFPILYLTSIYIFNYAEMRKCDTFLFATRDCSHLYKVFKALYPKSNAHYFHCSRLMFEQATDKTNIAYNSYVKSLVSDVDRTIFIDIHGTGKRALKYFKAHFGKVPYCFLVSAGAEGYDDLPSISQDWHHRGKLINLVFEARGSPIEMLNYDLMGTLQDYSVQGPIRDALEYKYSLVEPYHECIKTIVDELKPVTKQYILKELHSYINSLFKIILSNKPIISEKISHVGKHKASDRVIVDRMAQLKFFEVLNDTGVYGVIWSGSFNDIPCAIKMVKLTSGKSKAKSKDKDKKPFHHHLFENHKSMDPDLFMKESNNLVTLSKLELGPKVYDCFLHQPSKKVHYGFIVMEKLDGSVKEILLKRSLTTSEGKMALKLIKTLHEKHGIIHGDLKPSNMGVYLDKNGRIEKCVFIDCQKVKFESDLSEEEFERLAEKDRNTFKTHYRKNRDEIKS